MYIYSNFKIIQPASEKPEPLIEQDEDVRIQNMWTIEENKRNYF